MKENRCMIEPVQATHLPVQKNTLFHFHIFPVHLTGF